MASIEKTTPERKPKPQHIPLANRNKRIKIDVDFDEWLCFLSERVFFFLTNQIRRITLAGGVFTVFFRDAAVTKNGFS